ncbi:hypothetical protein JYT36_00490 [Bacteroidales bacterium AH-315-N07]|nr:hypothetical protein [Bacteroidales bacterium AH-315-N07]
MAQASIARTFNYGNDCCMGKDSLLFLGFMPNYYGIWSLYTIVHVAGTKERSEHRFIFRTKTEYLHNIKT